MLSVRLFNLGQQKKKRMKTKNIKNTEIIVVYVIIKEEGGV